MIDSDIQLTINITERKKTVFNDQEISNAITLLLEAGYSINLNGTVIDFPLSLPFSHKEMEFVEKEVVSIEDLINRVRQDDGLVWLEQKTGSLVKKDRF